MFRTLLVALLFLTAYPVTIFAEIAAPECVNDFETRTM